MIFQEKEIVGDARNYTWVRVVNPSLEEINFLSERYHLEISLIIDAMDPDELARNETLTTTKGRLVIMRLPYAHPGKDFTHTTLTFSSFLLDDAGIVITVCKEHIAMFDQAIFNRDILYAPNLSCFVLNILLYAGMEYLRYLKELKNIADSLEMQLDGAVHNQEVVNLMRIEKSLHYFKTSLRSNEILLEKIQKSPNWSWSAKEKELLDDVAIEMREAVEISEIYLNILHSMAAAFASVTNNNVNQAMKRLTVISLVLMMPTVVASFFGMNVALPVSYTENPLVFWVITAVSAAVSILMMLILRIRNFF